MHMAKDGKGALSFQPLLGVIRSILWGSHGGEVADPMIEAEVWLLKYFRGSRAQVKTSARLSHES
jgi:hypothetical protein